MKRAWISCFEERCASGARGLAALGVLALTGCSWLSAASSMRVEVEVYKGPLSKQLEVQVGELCGTLSELDKSLAQYHSSLYSSVLSLSKDSTDSLAKAYERGSSCERKIDVDEEEDESSTVKPMVECWCSGANLAGGARSACLALAAVHDEVDALRIKVNQSTNTKSDLCDARLGPVDLTDAGLLDVESTRKEMQKISELALHLKIKAMYRAEADAATRPDQRLVRTMTAGFANLTAEYSNQLTSRTDALLKQAQTQARFLPQSVYLRDSQPTEFVNLYPWTRAAQPALLQDFVLHPIDSMSGEEAANRVRGIERLFGDNYWSHINTVYASGQGDVSMALVKDDIGNWNLKSFSSDPMELLKAYKQGGLALIKTAAKLAETPALVPKANEVLGFANTLSLGSTGDQATGEQTVERLHARVKKRLDHLQTSLAMNNISEQEAADTAARILAEHESTIRALAESSMK